MKLPQRVGDYMLLEQLGAGSFGTVYRARIEGDLGFRQEVAVKLVDGSKAKQSPSLITALADEAQFLARVNHPHVVAVRRFVRAEHEFLGEAWLMEMELVRGVPLSRLLRRTQEVATLLTVDAVLSMLLEGVDALVYAHGLKSPDGRSQALVHRDLKPDNLLVSTEGRLKVLDFGIALADDRLAPTTATGMAKGTPLYMSPEQVRGLTVDGRSDLYSLGAIAFECLTGQRYIALPRGGHIELPAVIMAVATTEWNKREPLLEAALCDPSPDGRGIEPERARPIIELIGRMVAADANDRPSSAAALGRDLEELAGAWKAHLGRRYLRNAVEGMVEPWTDPEAPTIPSADVELTLPAGRDVDAEPAGPTRWAPPAQPVVAGPDRRVLVAAAVIGVALLLVGLGVMLRPGQPGGPEAVPTDTEPLPSPTASTSPVASPSPTAEPTPSPEASSAPTPATPTPRPTATARADAPTPTPAAPTPAPRRWPQLVHSPPELVIPGNPLTVGVRLDGGDVDCKPELMIRPKGGAWARRVMLAGSAGAWSATMQIPYDGTWNVGAEYFIRCCDGGECGASVGTRAAPRTIAAPTF